MSHLLIWKADGETRGAEEALGKRIGIHSTSNSHWKLGVQRDRWAPEDKKEEAEQLNG